MIVGLLFKYSMIFALAAFACVHMHVCVLSSVYFSRRSVVQGEGERGPEGEHGPTVAENKDRQKEPTPRERRRPVPLHVHARAESYAAEDLALGSIMSPKLGIFPRFIHFVAEKGPHLVRCTLSRPLRH